MYWYYAPLLYGFNNFNLPGFTSPISAVMNIDTSYPTTYISTTNINPSAKFIF